MALEMEDVDGLGCLILSESGKYGKVAEDLGGNLVRLLSCKRPLSFRGVGCRGNIEDSGRCCSLMTKKKIEFNPLSPIFKAPALR
jgi:hypothetical protein